MDTVLAVAEQFPEQVNVNVFLGSVFYTICSAALIIGIIAIGLIDSGVSRYKNALDTWVQKIIGSMLAGAAFLVVGFGIWMWQYYDAFNVASPLAAAVGDWWLLGDKMTTPAVFFDPALTGKGDFNLEVDVFQVFVIFFAAFMAFAAALFHGAGLERAKPAAYYVMCVAAGGLIIPVILYLTWGSVSPLTNEGVHDYVGLFGLYIFVGCWALLFAWRLKPRLGAFAPDARTSGPKPSDVSRVGIGVLIVSGMVPFIALGCGFIIPEVGYLGISMTTSGFGLTLINIFAALFGGAISGAILAYRKGNAYWALLGPLTGYVAGTAMYDITKPWIMLLVALPAPLIAYATYNALYRLRIDETKIVPMLLGPGIYGALMPGIVHWGTATGGFVGLTEGAFAFQHAEINLLWQAIGLAVTMAISFGSGLLLIAILERTIGLRVDEREEIAGLDSIYWGQAPISDLDDRLLHDPHHLQEPEAVPAA